MLLNKLSGKLPLRIILTLLFVLQVIIAVGLVGWLSFSNGQQAVNDLATQLRNELTFRIQQHLQTYLEMPHLVNQLNADAVRLGTLDLKKTDLLETYLWHQKKHFETVSYTAIGTETGNYIGAQFFADGSSIIEKMKKSENEQVMQTWQMSDMGKFDFLEKEKPNYDPRIRPWYKIAKAKGAAVWTEIYAYFSGESMTISANQPIYDQKGKFVGVASADLILSEIGRFLSTLQVGKTGQTFIIERTGDLVASSTVAQPFKKQEGRAKRLQAINSDDPLLQGSAQFLLSQFSNDLRYIQESHHLKFEMVGKKTFLQVTPLRDKRGLDWLIVVVIPEADFMQHIHENTQTTIIFMAIALIIAIIIGFMTAKWIVHPILYLRDAAKGLENYEWEQSLPVERADEIGELARSFDSMATALREFISTLERKVKERTQELAKAYQRLKASQAQLVQSEKMASLGQMVAGVAHEINTPLGYVKNNAETLQDMLLPIAELVRANQELLELFSSETVDESVVTQQIGIVTDLTHNLYEDDILKDMHELSKDSIYGIEQISDIVISLKSFSRLDQTKEAQVNLNENLDNVLKIAHNLLKHKVTVKKEYGDIPNVLCSPSQLNQVFLNLITNAAQAIEKEPGLLMIKTVADNKRVQVTIKDNGKGIPPEVIPKIFDPFFTTKPVGYGTGLGLSVSYQIIRQHKGSIKVVSELGKGSKFLVTLPLK